MSDYPIHQSNVPLFVAIPAGVGTQYSPAQNVEEAISYSVQFIWSSGSALSGSIYLEASNDGVNFTQIQQTVLAISGASGSHMINVEKHSYSYFRLSCNITGGSATIDARSNTKSK